MPEFSQINSNSGLERYCWSENYITLIIILVVDRKRNVVREQTRRYNVKNIQASS